MTEKEPDISVDNAEYRKVEERVVKELISEKKDELKRFMAVPQTEEEIQTHLEHEIAILELTLHEQEREGNNEQNSITMLDSARKKLENYQQAIEDVFKKRLENISEKEKFLVWINSIKQNTRALKTLYRQDERS